MVDEITKKELQEKLIMKIFDVETKFIELAGLFKDLAGLFKDLARLEGLNEDE